MFQNNHNNKKQAGFCESTLAEVLFDESFKLESLKLTHTQKLFNCHLNVIFLEFNKLQIAWLHKK